MVGGASSLRNAFNVGPIFLLTLLDEITDTAGSNELSPKSGWVLSYRQGEEFSPSGGAQIRVATPPKGDGSGFHLLGKVFRPCMSYREQAPV